jgi:hypothetical protein
MPECHLFFDLEYYRKFNAGRNWDAMIDNLLDLVKRSSSGDSLQDFLETT